MAPRTPHVLAWPARTYALGGRALRVDEAGTSLMLGRSGPLAVPHASGAENECLSRRAIQVGIDRAGRPYLANLSSRHELVLRPWGRGASSDDVLPPAVEGSGQLRYLHSGWCWIRNGRPWDPQRRRFGVQRGDDRTSWVLVEVVNANPIVPLDTDTVTGSTTLVDVSRLRDWDLTDAQHRAVLVYYAQFLGVPPAVVPEIPADSLVERLAGVGEVSRLDHLIASAEKRGFQGGRGELLAWLIAVGHVGPRESMARARLFGLFPLLAPQPPYRPVS